MNYWDYVDLAWSAVDPWKYACPTCKAAIGETCVSPAGKLFADSHARRRAIGWPEYRRLRAAASAVRELGDVAPADA